MPLSKDLRIAAAFAEFQTHLTQNLGNPINLTTIAAFSLMMSKILAVITEKES